MQLKERHKTGRRKELQDVAIGLISSFNSRNNDIDGYWGIGVLYLLAQEFKILSLSFDLLNPKKSSLSPSISVPLTKYYHSMLCLLLTKKGLPLNYIRLATISIQFESEYDEKLHYFRSAYTPYVCTILIVDSFGKEYKAMTGGNCWPHNPVRERQRKHHE